MADSVVRRAPAAALAWVRDAGGRLVRSRLVKRRVGEIAQSTSYGRLWAALAGFLAASVFYFIVNGLLRLPVQYALCPRPPADRPRPVIPLGEHEEDAQDFLSVECFTSEKTLPVIMDAPFTDAAAREKGAEPLRVARYIVRKGVDNEKQVSQDVMIVEIRLEADGSTDRLVADLAMRKDGQWKRIPWWETNALAPSNHLAQSSVSYVVMRRLQFDTSANSLTTWIKSYWADRTQRIGKYEKNYKSGEERFITPKRIREVVAPELERLLSNDFGHLQKSGPMSMLRIINGPVQFLTLAAFVAAMVVMFARWHVFVRAERSYTLGNSFGADAADGDGHRALTDASKKDAHTEEGPPWWESELQRIGTQQDQHEDVWGKALRSASLTMWEGALNAIRLREGKDYEQVPAFLESYGSLEEERVASRAFFLRFLIGSMPALGFIGTVLGIGDALMGTGAVLSDELAKQQSGVATVALALGFAFDTTFIALVLSLVSLYFFQWLNADEEAVIQQARWNCLDVLVSQGVLPERHARREGAQAHERRQLQDTIAGLQRVVADMREVALAPPSPAVTAPKLDEPSVPRSAQQPVVSAAPRISDSPRVYWEKCRQYSGSGIHILILTAVVMGILLYIGARMVAYLAVSGA